jgi:hypothetical protein
VNWIHVAYDGDRCCAPVNIATKSGKFHSYIRFEVFTAVTMKNGVFWDVTLCGSCKNRSFGGT